LFLLLARLSFGLFNSENVEDGTLGDKCILWLKQNGSLPEGDKEREASIRESIVEAVQYHQDSLELGEELACFPPFAERLLDLFSGVDGYDAPAWDIDSNPFTKSNLEKWKRVYARDRTIRRESRSFNYGDAETPSEQTPQRRRLEGIRDEPDEGTRELELIMHATSHLTLEDGDAARASRQNSAGRLTPKPKKARAKKKDSSTGVTPDVAANGTPQRRDANGSRSNSKRSREKDGQTNGTPPQLLTEEKPTHGHAVKSMIPVPLEGSVSWSDLVDSSQRLNQSIGLANMVVMGVRGTPLTVADWRVFGVTVKSSADADPKALYHARFNDHNLTLRSLAHPLWKSLPGWIKSGNLRPDSVKDAMRCLPASLKEEARPHAYAVAVPRPLLKEVERHFQGCAPSAPSPATALGTERGALAAAAPANVDAARFLAFGSIELAIRMEAAFWLERQFRLDSANRPRWFDESDVEGAVDRLQKRFQQESQSS
jgi:hypothetical protein